MSEPSILELHLEVQSGGESAVGLLSSETDLSRNRIKEVMQKGAIWLTHHQTTQRIRRAKRPLHKGDTLHLYYNPTVLAQTPPAAELIHDGGDYSIWNKPAGMLSQGSKWGDHTTIVRWAEQHLQPQRSAFIVHRLDRAAHGLILLAHSKRSAAALSALFQQRKVTKIYRATVHGLFNPEQQPLTIRSPIDGKPAISHLTPLTQDLGRSTIEISIESGRKHQIRRHLAEIGHPIVGDRLYGEGGEQEGLMLCSCELSFTSPMDGEEKRFSLLESQNITGSGSGNGEGD